MIDFFDESELIGQSLFDKLKFIKPEITKSVYEQKGSCNDVKLRSGNTYCMAEIKVRMDCDLHTSVKYGPYCEFIKFAAIKRKAESIMVAKHKNTIEIIKYSDYEIGSHGSFKISEK